MVEEEKIQQRTGGIESTLEGVGTFYLFSSVIAAIAFIFIALQDNYQKMGLTEVFIIFSIAFLVNGIIFQILFKAAAEVIRLLKRLNGLPYGGLLSVTETDSENDNSLFCSECGEQVAIKDKICTQCGATL
ncbi:MAG: zinc ribbon domain-containing protein [Ignavibacteriaceae bacterium]